jgi:hypothetical protein
MLFGEYTRIVNIAVNSRLRAIGMAREFADPEDLCPDFPQLTASRARCQLREPDLLLEAKYMGAEAPRRLDIAAAVGLAIGGVFGLAGAFVGQAELRQELWAIDGVALVVATALLTVKFLRQGNDLCRRRLSRVRRRGKPAVVR